MNRKELIEKKLNKHGTVHSESMVHRGMKLWAAIKYSKNVPLEKIVFEKRIKAEIPELNKFTYTKADVYIDVDGGISIECQLNNGYQWIWDYLDRRYEIIKRNCSRQIIVFPKNMELLHPVRWEEGYREFVKRGIEIDLAPVELEIKNKEAVTAMFSYKALKKLAKLRNRYSKYNTINGFIENDLENLLVR